MLTRIAVVGDQVLAGLAGQHARAFAAVLGLDGSAAEALGLDVDEAVRFT